MWRVDRAGDEAVAWACEMHLGTVCLLLLRAGEVTDLQVRNTEQLFANAGPIPWRPAGILMPAPGKQGEWHDMPNDSHDFEHCPCNPELHVSTGPNKELRSVWRHT